MEFFQALQWTFGELLPSSKFGYLKCPEINQAFTIIAYALIWIQPVLFGVIGMMHRRYLHGKHNNRLISLSASIVLQSFVVCLWAMLSLIVGLFQTPSYSIPDSNYGLSTCSEIGSYGHIGWRFAPATIKYQPTEFVYVGLILSSIATYTREYKLSLGLGWILTMIWAILTVGFGVDLPAYWCLLSIFVDPLIILNL